MHRPLLSLAQFGLCVALLRFPAGLAQDVRAVFQKLADNICDNIIISLWAGWVAGRLPRGVRVVFVLTFWA